MERGIFTWGDNSYGQLGHGDLEPREMPTEVILLRGKSIIRYHVGISNYLSAKITWPGIVYFNNLYIK